MGVLEAFMLACFAVSWPISIARALRTKRVDGKSPLFMMLICMGYAFGIANKLLGRLDWVTALYAFNMVLVLVDLVLWFRYRTGKLLWIAPRSSGRERDHL